MKHSTKSLLVGTIGAAGLFLAGTNSVSANTTHKIVNHDTVWDISQKYGVSVQSIEQLNHISATSNLIYPGQEVQIPSKEAKAAPAKTNAAKPTANTSTYSVKAGDSLWGIAKAHKTSVQKLLSLNGLDSSLIQPGQSLKVVGNAVAEPVKTPAQPVAQPKAPQPKAATPQVSANHTSYKVQAGDSLYTIAEKFGVSVNSIRSANALNSPALIAGQTLTINDPAKAPVAPAKANNQNAKPVQKTAPAAKPAASQSQAPTQNSTPARSTPTPAPSNNNAQPKPAAPSNNTGSASYGSVTSYAQSFKGTPYVWGGSNPGTGFDCSGFVQYVFAHFGKQLPRVTSAQENAGTQIPVNQAQAGDLYFWGSRGSSYHVAIALGGGSFIHAPQPGEGVKVGQTQYFQPSFAVRVR